MKKKTKRQMLVELTKEELLEINGGSERKDEKRKNFWESLKLIFVG